MSTCGDDPSEAVIVRLQQVQPDHLRVDLHLDGDAWLRRARKAIELADRIDSKLEVALFSRNTSDSAWRRCLEYFCDRRDRIARWLVFDPTSRATPAPLAEATDDALHAFHKSIPVVAGTNAYSAELNRTRPPVRNTSQVCYSINPQVHAFDKLSLCETLEGQRETAETAAALFARPVVVSPITLRPRFNPNATSTADRGDLAEPETDPRQTTGFAAAWTVGSLAQRATHPAIASLTFYETFGPRGSWTRRANPINVDCHRNLLDSLCGTGQAETTGEDNRRTSGGAGVLVISSEIDELIGICDRILVMGQGEIKARAAAMAGVRGWTRRRIGLWSH